jgi:hypothetical protein
MAFGFTNPHFSCSPTGRSAQRGYPRARGRKAVLLQLTPSGSGLREPFAHAFLRPSTSGVWTSEIACGPRAKTPNAFGPIAKIPIE